MPRSVMSVFSEPDEFQAALREEGVLNLLVTGLGEFRARLIQVTLHHLRLLAGEERLSRIVFAAVPTDTLFVLWPAGDRPGPIWDGGGLRVGEMITLGPGQRIHSRTDGLCHWAAIQLSAEELAQFQARLACEEEAGAIASRMAVRAEQPATEAFGKAYAKVVAGALLDEDCKGGKALSRETRAALKDLVAAQE